MKTPKLNNYEVKLLDTLRVSIAVMAESAEEAQELATKRWSNALWEQADPAITDCCCIEESTQRAILTVTCDEDQPNESTERGL